jgi:hypothetical protein
MKVTNWGSFSKVSIVKIDPEGLGSEVHFITFITHDGRKVVWSVLALSFPNLA